MTSSKKRKKKRLPGNCLQLNPPSPPYQGGYGRNLPLTRGIKGVAFPECVLKISTACAEIAQAVFFLGGREFYLSI